MGARRTRKASLYRRGDRIFVERVDTTMDGIPFSTDDVAVFDASVSDEVLGQALQGAIHRARAGVRPLTVDDWGAALRPLLRAAKVGSWKAFVRGCRNVSVFEDSAVVRFIPSINLGAKEGFGDSEEPESLAGVQDIANLGRVAKSALEQAVPHG